MYSGPEPGLSLEMSVSSSGIQWLKTWNKQTSPRRKYRVQTQPIVKLKIQAAPGNVVQGYKVQTRLVEKSKVQAAPRVVIRRYKVQTRLVERSKIQAAPRIVIRGYVVQNQLVVQQRGVAAELEIIARDTIDASDDSLGNDLKGVRGCVKRAPTQLLNQLAFRSDAVKSVHHFVIFTTNSCNLTVINQSFTRTLTSNPSDYSPSRIRIKRAERQD